MSGNVGANLLRSHAALFLHSLEFSAGVPAGISQRHLDAAERVNFAFRRGFNGKKKQTGILRADGGHDAVGLRRGHAAERFHAQDEMTTPGLRVVQRLANLDVSLAATGERVIPRRCQVT